MLLFSTLLTLLLVWSAWDQIRLRLGYEKALARQATASLAETIHARMQEMEARLRGFASREQALLGAVAASPDSPALIDSLWLLMQLEFPEAEQALVLNAGNGRIAPLGGSLEGASLIHLRQLMRGTAPSLRIIARAGRPESADIATTWQSSGDRAGGLLISIGCQQLCGPITAAAPGGHSLRLRPAVDFPDASSGDPDSMAGAAGRFGPLLARLPLADTGWVLEDRLSWDQTLALVFGRVALALALAAAMLLAGIPFYRRLVEQSRDAERVKADLHEGQLKLQAVLAATTEGMVLTDAEGRVELFNPAAEMMFGRLAVDVLRTEVFKLLPEFFSTASLATLMAEQPGIESPTLVRESNGRRRGGEEFPVRLWMSTVRFDGQPHLLMVVQDLTEHAHNEEKLVFLEHHDVLTGLPNRREFEHRLSQIIDRDLAGAGPHALCYVDVDQFKLVNDTCGHDAGDELLKQIAVLFESKMRGTEIIARLGGDEFGALLLNCAAEEATRICDGFMQTVRSFLFTSRDQSFDVAVSIGLVEFAVDSESASSILGKADVACEMAKRHGRDRIHLYHEGDTELVRHHGDMRLVATISRALSDGRFRLYAQPIVPIAAGYSKRHFEVLVRMVDENGIPVIPDDFIPAAERYILMPSVDRWIINHLFSLQAQNLRAWHAQGCDGFLFAVNLSGTSITDEGFLRYLKRQFTEWDVPYQSICFEITETAAVRKLEQARTFMEELSALGCSFALDDFGTGLSSYSYLRELPVDYLKIDGSFVRGMTEDPVNHALVDSINQIGHVLGLRTIAEWAEDKATVNQLRALNVDFAQGYAVGEPVLVDGITLADAVVERPLQRAVL